MEGSLDTLVNLKLGFKKLTKTKETTMKRPVGMSDDEWEIMINDRKKLAEQRMSDADAIDIANKQFAASESLKGDAVFHLDKHALNTSSVFV